MKNDNCHLKPYSHSRKFYSTLEILNSLLILGVPPVDFNWQILKSDIINNFKF